MRPVSDPPELLAPAGSLDSAYYALQAGADAVYFGLQEFSARAAARNFSYEDARRLRTLSRRMGRRIYAAVNTLILPGEQQQLVETARFLDYLEVDAVILQDPAAVAIFRAIAPHIPLHGSTQMAVHDAAGVRWAQQLGLSRVVLAREMTAAETAAVQEAIAGDVELEVFIHGAQCWSFSGLCLASGRLLGRSANRGRCAQICRGRFGEQHPLSADDKALGTAVLEAAAMGVHCLKIEGRMKSPAYAAATVRWYREILDRGAGSTAASDREHSERVRTLFARNWSSGFWGGASAGVNLQYPGATGIAAGRVEALRPQAFRITASCDLQVRDGLLLETEAGFRQTGITAISVCRMPQGDRRGPGAAPTQLVRGECAWIGVTGTLPSPGSPVRVVSRHDSELPAAPMAAVPVWKPPVALDVALLPEGIRISCPWYSELLEISWEPARSPGKLTAQLEKVFGITSDLFGYSVRVTGEDPGWFAPASLLKALRRDWVARAEQEYWSRSLTPADAQTEPGNPELQNPGLQDESLTDLTLPSRGSLQRSGIPFLFPGDSLEEWIPASGPVVLPLFPISLGLPEWRELELYLSRADRPRVILGLGNPSAAERYQRIWSRFPRTAAFLDYGLYTLSHRARREYTARLPRVAAAAPWLEGEGGEPDSLTQAMDFRDFSPPLCISRSCFRRTRFNSCSGCNPQQPQHFELQQGKKAFRVTVYRCWSLFFASGA